MDVLYECDRTKCANCYGECHLTKDITHAKNFDLKEEKADNGENFMYAVEKSDRE